MTRTFENTANGHQEDVGSGATVGAVLFGPFYFAYKGAWGWAAAEFFVSAFLCFAGGAGGFAIAVLLQLCLALAARGVVANAYLSRGWREVRPGDAPPQHSLLREPSADATKQCPDCAETVKAEARICRYCRHEFS